MRNQEESGRSLLEIIAVLSIMVLVMVAGIQLWDLVMKKQSVQRLQQRIIALRTERRVNINSELNRNKRNERVEKQGEKGPILTVQNGIESDGNENKDSFWITLSNVSSSLCDSMAKIDKEILQSSKYDVSCTNANPSVKFYFPKYSEMVGNIDWSDEAVHANNNFGHVSGSNSGSSSSSGSSGSSSGSSGTPSIPSTPNCSSNQCGSDCHSCGTGVAKCNSSTCAITSCVSGYFLEGGQCRTCPSSGFLTCSGSTLTCKPGYYRSGNDCEWCDGDRQYSSSGALSCSTCSTGKKPNSTHAYCVDCATDGSEVCGCEEGGWTESGCDTSICTQDSGCNQEDDCMACVKSDGRNTGSCQFACTYKGYLQSSGSQYIDTGVNATSSVGIAAKFNIVSLASSGTPYWSPVLGADTGWDSGKGIGVHGRVKQIKYGTSHDNNYSFSTGIDYSFVLSNGAISVNGTSISSSNETFTTNLPIYIFANNRPGGLETSISKFYSVRITNNGALVRDFVPVLDPKGVPAMYDNVEKKLYYNKGSGNFTYGDDTGSFSGTAAVCSLDQDLSSGCACLDGRDKTGGKCGACLSGESYVTWTQPTLTSSGTMGGTNEFACSQSNVLNSNHYCWKAFNGVTPTTSNDSYWHSSNSSNPWISWYTKEPIKINSITIQNRACASDWTSGDTAIPKDFQIQYSDDNSSWTTAFTGTNPKGCLLSTTFNVNASSAHRYWRLYATSNYDTHNYVSVGTLTINAEKLQTVDYTLDTLTGQCLSPTGQPYSGTSGGTGSTITCGTHAQNVSGVCKCDVGYYGDGQTCTLCGDRQYSAVGAASCSTCSVGQTHNSDHTACVDCATDGSETCGCSDGQVWGVGGCKEVQRSCSLNESLSSGCTCPAGRDTTGNVCGSCLSKESYTPWSQPTLTSNGTMGGSNGFACTASTERDSYRKAWRAFDKSNSDGEKDCWHNADGVIPAWLSWYTKVPTKLNSITITNRPLHAPHGTNREDVKDFKIQYSDNNSTWTDVYSGQNSKGALTSTTFQVNATSAHKYWRIYMSSTWWSVDSRLLTTIGELTINADELQTVNYTLDTSTGQCLSPTGEPYSESSGTSGGMTDGQTTTCGAGTHMDSSGNCVTDQTCTTNSECASEGTCMGCVIPSGQTSGTCQFACTYKEYLQSNGSQYIDTGVLPSAGLTFTGQAMFTAFDNWLVLFGSVIQDNEVNGIVFRHGADSAQTLSTWFCGMPSSTGYAHGRFSIGRSSVNYLFDFSLSAGSTSVNDFHYTFTSSTSNLTSSNKNTIYLFGGNFNKSFWRGSTARIYKMKINDGGSTVRNFVPVLDPDGIPAMLDRVENKLYYNKGSGQFTTGNTISAPAS